jgi:hypothetical protein
MKKRLCKYENHTTHTQYMHAYIHTYIYIYTYIHTYIYIEREREREVMQEYYINVSAEAVP